MQPAPNRPIRNRHSSPASKGRGSLARFWWRVNKTTLRPLLRKKRLRCFFSHPLLYWCVLSYRIGATRKLHRAVIHGAEAQTPHVTQVVLVHPPGVAWPLTRHHIACALYIT